LVVRVGIGQCSRRALPRNTGQDLLGAQRDHEADRRRIDGLDVISTVLTSRDVDADLGA
jgi:hypothetical protein